MSVELEPTELGFRRPFQREVAQVLRLRNNNYDPVAFKVKTTAPKQYCVRPNSGRIEAGKEIEVQVLLQAMKEDPPLDVKCRDKFLVQSVAVSADREFTNVASIWSHIEESNKSAIQEKKIRVVFLPPLENSADEKPSSSNGTSAQNGVHRSPSPDAATPQEARVSSARQPTATSTRQDDQSIDVSNYEPATPAFSTAPSRNQSTLSNITAAVSNAIPTDELKQQLAEAKDQIARLKEQVGQQGLRQRKTGAGEDSKGASAPAATAMGVQQAPAGGVSVQIVAVLCLLSFLLAYFFF